jgi:hypothetical protein
VTASSMPIPSDLPKDQFRFTNLRQEKIYQQLMLVGPGPAVFYKDACRLMDLTSPLASTSHLVGHLLREMESGLRDVLEPFITLQDAAKQKAKGETTHRIEVLGILLALGFSETDTVSEVWLRLTDKKDSWALHARAHRHSLDSPRPLTQDFLEFWETMQRLLEVVLERFETRFLGSIKQLDQLLLKSPSTKDAEYLRDHTPNTVVARGYFFERLTRVDWLLPLIQTNFFTTPPQPQRNEVEQTISFPAWPESRYLARIARLAPEIVYEVALRIPNTENLSVHQDLAEIALALGAKLAADFVPKAKEWLRLPWHSLLPDKLGLLMKKLAENGKVSASLDLASSLLEVKPAGGAFRDAASRLDIWEYEQILAKYYPALIDAAQEQALNLLNDLLVQAIEINRGKVECEEDDYSQIWLPSIEPHEQNPSHDIKELLTLSLRDAITGIAGADPSRVPILVVLLESRHRWIFQRLALSLLKQFPTAAPGLIADRLTSRRLFDERAVRREYSLLAEKCFHALTQVQQEVPLRWIESEPEKPEFRNVREANLGRKLSEEEFEKARNGWRVLRLRPMRDALPAAWREQYEKWVKEVGEPEYPELSFRVSGGAWEPRSPKTSEELSKMGTAELLEYLKNWKSLGDPMHSPSKSGLADQLGVIVDADLERFAVDAPMFEGLDPTYVRTFIGSFRAAVAQKRSFEWKSLFELLQWVVEQPCEISGRKGHAWEQDQDWGWTRRAVVDLLSSGFKDETPSQIPFEYRSQSWRVLVPLTYDPSPTVEEESRYWDQEKHGSIPTYSGIRGDALNAVIEYALWVRRHTEQQVGKEGSRAAGFNEMREVREVLDEHLDPEKDSSLAIRAIYGRLFPWLQHLDRNWAVANISRIWPRDAEVERFRRAAWDAYVAYCPPYNDVFEILSGEYRYVIELMEPHREESRPPNPDQRLTEHLVLLLGRGKLDLLPGGMLVAFYQKAPESQRAYFIEHAGRTLHNEKDLPAEVLNKLEDLWNWRLGTVREEVKKSGTQTIELASFRWWFTSGRFDDRWALGQLAEALKLSRLETPAYLVLKKLAETSATYPLETVECLAVLIDKDTGNLSIQPWPEDVRTILATAIHGDNAAAKVIGIELVHKLGSRGFFEYRSLLPTE